MKIVLAKSAGFCFGVKRATSMAFDSAASHPRICSLGPIIHSPQLVKKLEEEGVSVVDRVEDIRDGAVIIRSHGITANEMADIATKGLEVVDATCPFVKKAQDHAAMLSSEGYVVVLVGEEEHPEVQGIVSYAAGVNVYVVPDQEKAEGIPRSKKIGVVAQTTQPFENLRQVVDVCLRKSKELRVFNTICDATSVRQSEARDIARQVDLMLVIGGFNSANTNRLAQLCTEIQPRTYHVETANEIESSWFEGVKTVGVTAGASTPQWIIDEVLDRVSGLKK
ncbi:4-hydroxy-3-methylbut-2-enyl diphosphate reductase [Desulfuromonas sp. AOP6]|uniref:4-hydroxy-3-methylbut-2-enyl diphosphate reductase n=1 Tax=Desulfuromonas sp. AOP6 TaxID=1566351 RepID=UPI00126F53B7|nr:4-hydroxy-3-methylbut-2-enyl diphosphate reductase [Desulfuromonas sp. AOP6]BCA79635.1 4-hydroxy-3-methylbut-2-enyl diphosphatereductase [Desulfuromonas sp. AOP6]